MAKLTAEQESYIQKLMGERKLSRKSAVQFARRNGFPVPAIKNPVAPPEQQQLLAEAAQAHETAEQAIGDVAPAPDNGQPHDHELERMLDEGGPCPERPKAAAPVTALPTPQATTTAPADAPAVETPKQPGKKGRKGKVAEFDSAKAVALYLEGKKVVDIAVALGYERGTGQNRVRIALMAAGVYKELPSVAAANLEKAKK